MRMPVTGRSISLVAAVLVLGAALAACSSGSGASSATPSSAPAESAAASEAPTAVASAPPVTTGDAVTIKDFSFGPGSITVAVGATVTWTNRDSVGHTVTADDGTFDSKRLSSGSSFSETFAAAGTYTYHCTIHPSMTGTIVVQ